MLLPVDWNPEPLDQELVRQMLLQLQAANADATICLQERILQGTGSELTPVKVVRKKLRESWLSTAVVVHKREWTSCSCCHRYAILVRLGLGLLQLKTKLPQNPGSDMNDADGSSAEDASPKRNKKRQRPCYRPMPAPVLPTSASPRPEPSPGKVLKPQKIAKFPFNR